ncbi:hypothetical protein DM02DRAFT_631191 [Periconia macrospinosa]|uniref:Uncharacterized protein n=1 Tax=Periconia macrospinosa TaxID=97972 RepID=A0A2V1DH87_9PLEO|nr:hypothetical protein DM02DRAFT_631191 [Periconia macrospinosa]
MSIDYPFLDDFFQWEEDMDLFQPNTFPVPDEAPILIPNDFMDNYLQLENATTPNETDPFPALWTDPVMSVPSDVTDEYIELNDISTVELKQVSLPSGQLSVPMHDDITGEYNFNAFMSHGMAPLLVQWGEPLIPTGTDSLGDDIHMVTSTSSLALCNVALEHVANDRFEVGADSAASRGELMSNQHQPDVTSKIHDSTHKCILCTGTTDPRLMDWVVTTPDDYYRSGEETKMYGDVHQLMARVEERRYIAEHGESPSSPEPTTPEPETTHRQARPRRTPKQPSSKITRYPNYSEGHKRAAKLMPEIWLNPRMAKEEHWLLSHCTPQDVNIRLCDFDFSVVEILTYFPAHTFWFSVAERLRRSGWTANAIAGCVKWARKYTPLEPPLRYTTNRYHTQRARKWFSCNSYVETANPSKMSDRTGGQHGRIDAIEYFLVGLAEGVIFHPCGDDARALTRAIAHARGMGHDQVKLSQARSYIEEHNLFDLSKPYNFVAADRKARNDYRDFKQRQKF